MMKSGNETRLTSMVYLRGVRGHKCTPLWRLVMYFCVHNCTSPSNDHAAVACSNNNQIQLHTHVSVISRHLTRPRVASRYSVRIFTWPEVGMATQKFSGVLCVPVAETPLSKFLNSPLHFYLIMCTLPNTTGYFHTLDLGVLQYYWLLYD